MPTSPVDACPDRRRTRSACILAAAVAAGAVGLAVHPGVAGASVPRAAQGAVQIARDSYHRTVDTGLGRADVGGKYTVLASRGTRVHVRSGSAVVTGLAPGHEMRAALPEASGADAMVTVSLTVPKAATAASGGFYFGPELRVRGAFMYRAKVRIVAGRVGLRLGRVTSTETTLAARSLPLHVASGQRLVVQAQVVGTTAPAFSMRAWVSGQTAPDWQLRSTDRSAGGLKQAGGAGVWAYASRLGQPAAFDFSGLEVWRLPITDANPQPSPSKPAPAPSSTPTPTSSTPAPAPAPGSSSTPAPAPSSSDPGPAAAPSTSHPAPAPVPISSSDPAPAPSSSDPAPAPAPSSSTPTPAPTPSSSSTPTAAPTPSSSTPTPAPTPSSSSTPTPAPTPSSSSTPAPAPSTSPVPPPPSGGSTPSTARGAAPLGTTNFPVPDAALFVAPSGSDSAAGTQSAPLRTVTAAISRAASGQTIVLRAGTYHESLQIGSGKSGVVIESAPNETVWLDGSSVVDGWSAQGSTWVHSGWTAQFDHSASFTSGRDDGMVGAQNPMAGWPDGVWVDGAELHQVASESAVSPGTFYADYAGNRLVIGSNPAGHEVRASDLAQAVKVSTSNVTLRGFGVRRYATSLPLIGTVRIDGNNNVLRDLVITDNATQGLSFRQSGNLVDHLTVTYNGMTGIHANVADGLTIRNSVVDDNNAQQFNAAPSAAGAKITRSRHLTITNDSFDDNGAAGLWFDQCDVYFTVANNSFQGDYIAVQLEMADTGIVANNTFRSGKYGLYVFDTGNVGVYNNSFADHSVGAVLMSQDQRRQSDPTAYQRDGDSRYAPGDATDPWLLRNVVVANNMFMSDSTAGMFQVYALDKRTNIPADAMNLTITGNYFRHRDTSAQPSMVGWGGSDNVTVTRYESPDALSTAKNPKWRNAQAPTGMQTAARVTLDQSIASPLPDDVAAAVGQPVGTQHIGTF